MKNILLCTILLGLFGSCSLEKIVMKSAHANKYQQDFLYLADLVEESFPYHERYFEGDFEQEKKIVFERLTKVEEPYKFDYAAKEFLAKLNNNHTYLRAEETEIFPLAIRIFDDELVIVNVGSKVDSNLIGQTIASINDTPASQLLKYSLALTEGETPFQDTSNARRAFYILNFYKYYGVLKEGKVLHVKTKESGNQVYDIPLLQKEDTWFYGQTYDAGWHWYLHPKTLSRLGTRLCSASIQANGKRQESAELLPKRNREFERLSSQNV